MKLPKKLAAPEKKIKRRKRQDNGNKNVIINAKRVKKTAKFQLENIPHPFSSREQYERAMGGAIGKEWNVTSSVKNMTRAEVITRAGKMIKPISKKGKMKRAPAKF
jgi:U3 small nucleolar RNA-associated protein 14